MIAFSLMVIALCAGRVIENQYFFVLFDLLKEDDLSVMELILPNFDGDLFTRKRMKKMNQCCLLLLVLPFVDNKSLVVFLCVVLIVCCYKLPYVKYKRKVIEIKENLKYELAIWLSYLITFMYQDVCYIALLKSEPYLPELLRKEFEALISSIRNNPSDLSCFDQFMKGYQMDEIEQTMSLLKNDSNPDRFEQLIRLNMEQISNYRKRQHETNLFLYQWLGLVPLFSITIVYLIIMADLITNSLESGVI